MAKDIGMKELKLEDKTRGSDALYFTPFDHDSEMRVYSDGVEMYLTADQIETLVVFLNAQLESL